jgi:hypothetical protein
MICPLRSNQYSITCADDPTYTSGCGSKECVKENCAWWVEKEKRCAIHRIPVMLEYICNVIDDIKQHTEDK